MMSRRHLAEVIGERTLHVRETEKLAREVAAYLLDTHHTGELDSLLRDVMEYRAKHGVVEAEAVSAHDITDGAVKGIEAILRREYPKAKSVQVIRRIDPSVVGGVRVSLANEQLDLTVRDQLDKFKRLTASIKE
jgi:F0F1-type ATP synthase delta subunit